MPSQNPKHQNPSEELKSKPPEFFPKKDVLFLLALSVLLLVFHTGIFIKFGEQMGNHFFMPFMWGHQLILVAIAVISVMIMLEFFPEIPLTNIYYYVVPLVTLFSIAFIFFATKVHLFL